MAASRELIRGWFIEGVESGFRWMIIACDTFNYEDYPVFIETAEEYIEKYKHYSNSNNMQRIMEVYDLAMDMESQLNENRAFHGPTI